MYKILKNIIEMDDYSVQKLSKSQPPVPFEWNTVEGTELNVSDCIGGKGKIAVKGNTYQATSILSEGYTQVDYIESHGNEYIDTGIIPSQAMHVVDIMSAEGNNKLNQADTGAPNRLKWGTSGSGLIYIGYGNNYATNIIATIDKFYIFDFEYGNQKITDENGNILLEANDNSITKWIEYSLVLFAGRATSGSISSKQSNMRRKRAKIYENNILVRDFIPCYRNSDNEVGLYDIVNNVFYTNQGTGAFTYGAIVTVPNPEYPIPIEVVTGDNVVKHVGKNWFNSEMEKGDISYTTGNNTSSSNRVRTKDFIPVFPNETYILKRYSFTGKQLGLRLYDQNQNYLGYKSAATTETITFATNEYSTADGTFSGEIYYIKLIDLENDLNATYQLELGSTATEYEPYKENAYQLNLGNIELCKIGDNEDVLFKNVVGDENYNAELESGAWYKKNAIGIYEFTGNEEYQKSSRYSDSQYFCAYTKTNILTNILINGSMYCTRIGTIGYYTEILDKECIRCAGQANIRILASRLKEASEQALKDLLKQWYDEGNPMKAYYSLDTPTYTKITDPTLISQLEVLNKFKWFKGVNHIWTETDNLEPVLKGTYRQAINE